jgi:hypothetical protein
VMLKFEMVECWSGGISSKENKKTLFNLTFFPP